MLNALRYLSQHRLYWVLLIMLGVMLEGVAFYYQYVLHEWPCVLCIHVRIWIAGFILLAVFRLLAGKQAWVVRTSHALNSLIMIAIFERSWTLLGVERGWTFGDCSIESGLPDWFAIDQWFPLLFEIQTTCGYTPELLFGVTMAESLVALFAALFLLSLLLFLSCFRR